MWQLLVPKDLRQCVLQAVHGSVGAGLFGVAKTLNRLRQRFYWAGSRWDTELLYTAVMPALPRKDRPERPTAAVPSGGAPMEKVRVDILGTFHTTDSGNRYVLVAIDYFIK